jgi:hypothetical protein
MFVPSRSRRRHEHYRLRRRMIALWKIWSRLSSSMPTSHWLGNMIATHGVPCSGYCCGNRRRYEGPTRAERIADEQLHEGAGGQ